MFVAVDPPDAARRHLDLALGPLRVAPGAPRWSRSATWHLTLLFLGQVPDAVVPRLLPVVGAAVAGAPAMSLRLAGAGRFGSVRRPQVAWAGVEGDVAALSQLAVRLAGTARELGLAVEERPFRPHLTLGRWRPGRPADGALVDRLAGYRGPEWPVREVRLVESHLGAGARHDTLAAWPLGT